MKTITKFLPILVFLFSIKAFAQSKTDVLRNFANSNDAKISFTSTTETVQFIRFSNTSAYKAKGNNSTTKSFGFIDETRVFGNLSASDFILDNSKEDSYGLEHVTLNQTYNGIPVFDGELKFHFNSSKNISAINGNIVEGIKINTSPSISILEAKNMALELINNQNINYSVKELFVQQNDLLVYPRGIVKGQITSNYLAYYIEVRNNLDVREYLFIDAHNGELLDQFTGIAHAINRIVYEGNTNPVNIVWEEGDALPGSLSDWQQNEVIASEHTYNFFKNAFSYTSYDGADAQMITINNNPNISCPNATWNGFSANYCDGTASDDVIAHEWGHAYTEYTNNLIYAWQSGAINEAYSDIWGETIDLLNNYEDADDDDSIRNACNSSDRWRVGEDATAFGGAIRDMWDPTCNGDPGKVTDGVYWCTTGDSGGVHINSGIPNHAYALLVDGGIYNTYTISSIGFTKAAHIFWRAQSQYLTATSDFEDLADALEASANDLLGIDLEGLSTSNTPAGLSGEIITVDDVQTVIDVILAVEMRINPDACNFQPVLGTSPSPCGASTTNPIFLEDWETGTDGWSFTQLPENASTWESRDWVLSSNLPNERTGNAIFGTDPINGNCTTDLENGIIRLESPLITIPDYTTGITELFFNHYVATEANWDGANIKYQLDSGSWEILPSSAFTTNPYNGTINAASSGNDNPMENQDAFTGSDEGSVTSTWGTSIVDLSQVGVTANSTIKFRFEMGTDGCNGREGWYIDELAVYNCNFALSVKDFDNLNQVVKIYPNPSNGVFNLRKLNQVDLLLANIYDLNGRLIKKVDLENMNVEYAIDITSVSEGLYFIEVVSKDNRHTFKVNKN